MRVPALIWSLVLPAVLCGCDPGGLRRVQLQLRTPASTNSEITVDSADAKEALKILDSVVTQQGFHLTQTTNGYIRAYSLSRPPVTVDGRVYSRDIPCRARLTSTGILVTFGEFGFLASCPE